MGPTQTIQNNLPISRSLTLSHLSYAGDYYSVWGSGYGPFGSHRSAYRYQWSAQKHQIVHVTAECLSSPQARPCWHPHFRWQNSHKPSCQTPRGQLWPRLFLTLTAHPPSSACLAGLTFKIYPESEHFSPPPQPPPGRSHHTLSWVIATASTLGFQPLPLPPKCPQTLQPERPLKPKSQMSLCQNLATPTAFTKSPSPYNALKFCPICILMSEQNDSLPSCHSGLPIPHTGQVCSHLGTCSLSLECSPPSTSVAPLPPQVLA